MPLTPEEQRELELLELKALEAKAAGASPSSNTESIEERLRAAAPKQTPDELGKVNDPGRKMYVPTLGEGVQAMALTAFPVGRIGGIVRMGKEMLKQGAAGAAAEEARSLIDEGKNASAKSLALNAVVPALAPPLAAGAGAVIGKAAGRVSPEEVARIAALRLNNQGRDAALAGMRQRGDISVVPSSVDPTPWTKIKESVAGIENLQAGVARNNQPIFNEVARAEASMPGKSLSSQANFEQARSQIGAVYNNTRSAGVGEFLDNWRSASTKLRDAEKVLDAGYTVERGAAVDAAQKAKAEAEELLELALQEAGDPVLVEQIRAAKQAFGKNYDVDKAVLSGTDDVRPQVLSQMLEQRGEAGLSGGLRDIAKFNNNFPRSAKNPSKLATAPGAASAGAALVAGGGEPVATAAMVGGVPMLRGMVRDRLVEQGKRIVPNYRARTSADPEAVARAYNAIRAAAAAGAAGRR